MLQLPQAECPVRHIFGPGLYIREVTLPAGTFAIGHYQKTAHMNIMLTGRVLMVDEYGIRTILTAPRTFMSEPGRKVGYILETVIWQNVYATNETDIEKLEATYLEKSNTFLLNQKQQFTANQISQEINRLDYKVMLDEVGFTHEVAKAQSENEDDQIPMPGGAHPYQIAKSPIDGMGYFLTAPCKAGAVLAPARIGEKRTPAGRYVNHSMTPNAKMIFSEDGNIYLIALRDIAGATGGGIGEEVTTDYRETIKLLRAQSCQA